MGAAIFIGVLVLVFIVLPIAFVESIDRNNPPPPDWPVW